MASQNEKGRHPLAWMPFGARQQCIGGLEGTPILSRFAQRYRVVPSDKPAPEFRLLVDAERQGWHLGEDRTPLNLRMNAALTTSC